MQTIDRKKVLRILYMNHRGATAWRLVVPMEKPPGHDISTYHRGEWTFPVYDLDKQERRDYAFSGILWAGGVDVPVPTYLKLTYGTPPESKV